MVLLSSGGGGGESGGARDRGPKSKSRFPEEIDETEGRTGEWVDGWMGRSR